MSNDREKDKEPEIVVPSEAAELTPEQELAHLEQEAASLSFENEELTSRLLDDYTRLIKLLNDPKNPLFREVIRAKKDLERRRRETKPTAEAAPEVKPVALDERLDDETIIPKEDSDKFRELFGGLPEPWQRKYAERLQAVFKSRDEASTVTAFRGAIFEMSRIVTLVKQGQEQIDFAAGKKKITLNYMGYGKPKEGESIDYTIAPSKEMRNATVELDVPVVREGLPYAYETKSYPRMQYGTDVQSKNQLLKYQAAIEQGLISGATLEIRGRLDPSFLDWAIGTRLDDPGHVPNVEIIYTFDLPSGKEYRFVLKRVKEGEGLRFKNEERYDDQDQQIIRGIQQSLADKSVRRIITEVLVDPERASPELRPLLDDPVKITSRALFEEYDKLRNEAICEKLRGKVEAAKINTENKKSSVSEFANPKYVERLILEYQDFLRQNPELAKAKWAYILLPEKVPLAVERVMAAVGKIAVYERARAASPEEAGSVTTRQEMGYLGRPEGVALDIDHVMMDAIYSINKEGLDRVSVEKILGKQNLDTFTEAGPDETKVVLKYKSKAELEQDLGQPENGSLRAAYEKFTRRQKEAMDRFFKESEFVRSYDWSERFTTVEHLPEILEGQDRRYLEIQVLDPRDGKVTRHTDTNEEDIARTKNNLVRENIQRAKEHIQGTKREPQHKSQVDKVERKIQQLEKERDEKISQEQKEAQKTAADKSKELSELRKRRGNLVSAGASSQEMAILDGQIVEIEAARTRAFGRLREISAEYQGKIMEQYSDLTGIYRQIIPENEWHSFAKSITKTIDQNIIKFIYAVTAEGEVTVQEEILRGDVSGRAAHSELAQGRNVYGAGELAFTKIGKQWVLTEINNGSGHYRPDALSSLSYVKNLIKAKGLDVSQAQLTDCILRGVPLKDASAF